MDPPPSPPGSSDAAAGTAAIPAAAADPAPLRATAHNHPPYDEMIFAVISAMKSATGPSKEMISDYILQTHRNLPPNHSTLLTHHLKSLKASGLIVMSKNSYRLPEPEGSTHPKRGRPAKSKAVALLLSDDEAQKTDEVAKPRLQKRGRGRGRPARTQDKGPVEEAALPENGAGRPKRARGRPPKVNMVPFASEDAGAQTGIGPQDQPKVVASRVGKFPVRRRGRPSRSNATTVSPADQPNLSGPSAAVAAMHVHGFEYEILQKKVEIIQRRIKDAVAVLKTHLVGEVSANVMSAIIELEAIAVMDMKASLTVDSDAIPS